MSYEQIPGWFGFSKAYDEMIATARDGDILIEVGVAFGRSLAYLAEKTIASGKKLTIYGVDPWLPEWDADKKVGLGWGGEHVPRVLEKGGPFSSFVDCMQVYSPMSLDDVRVLRCPSLMAAKMFEPRTVHAVLIDGSHHYEDVLADIKAWLPKVRDGGILAGDDWSEKTFPGVCQAVREAFGENFDKEHGDYGTTWVKRL